MARTRIPHEVDAAIIEENTKGRPEMTIFAKTLNHLLVEKGIHQDDLAQALGISSGSISSYRRGEKEPRFTMIVKIADYLGVDCHYLMTGVRAEHYSVANELGLSEDAIDFLYDLKEEREDLLKAINRMLLDNQCLDFWENISLFLFSPDTPYNLQRGDICREMRAETVLSLWLTENEQLLLEMRRELKNGQHQTE